MNASKPSIAVVKPSPLKSPGLIAHRGASGHAPENTLAAFAVALEMGAEAVEFDVQQTRDGRLVVCHDTDFKRTAGTRRTVAELSYGQISRLDVGSWFGPAFQSERVPLLEEVLDLADSRAPGPVGGLYPKGPGERKEAEPGFVELQLEIKQAAPPYNGIAGRVGKLLDSRPRWSGRVVVSSFHHPTLHEYREMDPKARLGYLVGLTRKDRALREARELACESVHLGLRQVNRAWVEAIHGVGMKVLVYTVNTREDLDRMRGLKVDGVFTNFPDLGVRP